MVTVLVDDVVHTVLVTEKVIVSIPSGIPSAKGFMVIDVAVSLAGIITWIGILE